MTSLHCTYTHLHLITCIQIVFKCCVWESQLFNYDSFVTWNGISIHRNLSWIRMPLHLHLASAHQGQLHQLYKALLHTCMQVFRHQPLSKGFQLVFSTCNHNKINLASSLSSITQLYQCHQWQAQLHSCHPLVLCLPTLVVECLGVVFCSLGSPVWKFPLILNNRCVCSRSLCVSGLWRCSITNQRVQGDWRYFFEFPGAWKFQFEIWIGHDKTSVTLSCFLASFAPFPIYIYR